MQEEGLKGLHGRVPQGRLLALHFPPLTPVLVTVLASPVGARAVSTGPPSSLFCLLARPATVPSVFSSLSVLCSCGAWAHELEESRRGHGTEKWDLGFPRPVRFLLKSGLDSVGLLGGHLALTQAGLQRLHPWALHLSPWVSYPKLPFLIQQDGAGRACWCRRQEPGIWALFTQYLLPLSCQWSLLLKVQGLLDDSCGPSLPNISGFLNFKICTTALAFTWFKPHDSPRPVPCFQNSAGSTSKVHVAK